MRACRLALLAFALGILLPTSAAGASASQSGYIPMADGAQLSYTVVLPAEQGRFPVALIYDGYSDGTSPGSNDPALAKALEAAGYAVLGVNVRGTGCSSGTFDLRAPEESSDGATVVRWAAMQQWSTGAVGMAGDSFPGLTQPGVAALRPSGLKAIAPFQLIDDVYRDVGYPGGVYNGEFGAFWGLGDQPASDASNIGVATAPAQVGGRGDAATCDPNYAGHAVRNPSSNIFIAGTQHPWFDDYWSAKTVGASAKRISVPVLGCLTWQDDEVGSNPAWSLWRHVDSARLWLIASNGYHGLCDVNNDAVNAQVVKFFDRYVKGIDNGFEGTPHVQIWHETRVKGDPSSPGVTINLGPLGGTGGAPPQNVPAWITTARSWPPALAATPLYLHGGGLLNRTARGSATPESYNTPRPSAGTENGIIAGQKGALWQQPVAPGGALAWTTPALTQDVELLGPASADLWLRSSATDTDLQVTVTEVRPDGQETYVARGWLRASHRRLDAEQSTSTYPVHLDSEAAAQPLGPGSAALMRVEVFPFDHVFRAGSSIRLIVDTPSPTGGWNFAPVTQQATNSVLHDRDHPSRLVAGVVAGARARAGLPGCNTLLNQPCRANAYPVPSGRLTIAPRPRVRPKHRRRPRAHRHHHSGRARFTG